MIKLDVQLELNFLLVIMILTVQKIVITLELKQGKPYAAAICNHAPPPHTH